MDSSFASYLVEDRSYVAYIKREIHNRIAKTTFSQGQAGEIDIIVSEITSNMVKHAGRGQLLYRVRELPHSETIFEVISIDHGPGMSDTARMMKDGISTTGTLGEGLGAIKRLSTSFSLYSIPGWGTILYSLVATKKSSLSHDNVSDVEIRALCVNKPKEKVCGDGYAMRHNGTSTMIFFADGLGHGEKAKEAVDEARNFFFETKVSDPVDLLKEMHQKLRKTRGLVGTVAVCDLFKREWRVCGIGNISTRVYTNIRHKNYMSYNGTVGMVIPTSMHTAVFPVEKNQHLIMCSDGLQSRWDLSKYPGVLKHDPMILAACFYKDFTRGNDDSSVLIAKIN